MEDKLPNRIRYNKHRKRKNNDLVAAMYAMYRTGKSLAQIGGIYGKTRQAIYDLFRTRGYELRSKESAGRYVSTCYGVKWYRSKGGYLRGSINGRRTMLHREVWERMHGPVPDDHVLYFRDGDHTRCTIENLAMITKSEMQKVFNPTGRNQFSSPKHS